MIIFRFILLFILFSFIYSCVNSINTNVVPANNENIKILNIQKKIIFDISKEPLGKIANNIESSISKLTELLEKNNFKVTINNIYKHDLNSYDILVLLSPSKEYTSEEISKITKFVDSGKKLIILGEWGGYPEFEPNSINTLLKNYNLHINLDLIKETQKQNYLNSESNILVYFFIKHPVTDSINEIALFNSASINLIDEKNEKSKIIAYSSSESFKLESLKTSKYGVVGAYENKNSKVIVIGDTTAFLNPGEFNNIEEKNNKDFALNLFKF